MTSMTFIDVETTGLSPKTHEIIEIGAIEVDFHTLEEIRRIDVKIKPQRIDLASPKALEVNGYSAQGWVNAVDLGEALVPLAGMINNRIWVGHNPGFDKGFIEAAYWATGRMPPVASDMVDTKAVAKALQDSGAMKFISLSLSNVAAAFGLSQPSPHRALDDAMLCWQVVKKVKAMRGAK